MHDILNEIPILWARQEFSPRETSYYILSRKEVLSQMLEKRSQDEPA